MGVSRQRLKCRENILVERDLGVLLRQFFTDFDCALICLAFAWKVLRIQLKSYKKHRRLTQIIQDQQAQSLLPMEMRLLRQPEILHGSNERVKVPMVQIRVKLQSQCSFHIIL